MASVRNEKMKSIRAEKQNSQSRLAEQKNHFENIIARHQGFIEQVGLAYIQRTITLLSL